MAQPKKLTHKEKLERQIMIKLDTHTKSLDKIERVLKKTDTPELYKWAALETFKMISKEFNLKNHNVEYQKNRALQLARDAQSIMNFL
jgi:hypothetical protein